MPFTPEQVMLTLAGLTYRGFHQVLRDEGHDGRVRDAVDAGLQDLAPVTGEWDLVWGPATSRSPRELTDTNAMYVVRHRLERQRYVVAIRGTNPISLADWRFGDFWVNATVPWPYAPAAAGAAVSASTALGLAALQAMRSRPSARSAGGALSSFMRGAVGLFARTGTTTASRLGAPLGQLRSTVGVQLTTLIDKWRAAVVRPEGIEAVLRELRAAPHPLPDIRRPRPLPTPTDDRPVDLLTFLASQASNAGAALDVTVTGHSKGAALAQAVALWLREALDSPDERWDGGRGARIHCHVFAGPTAGNAAFARRFENALGATHHHVRNVHDIVTHAWQADELGQIPRLYGARTALLEPVAEALAAGVGPLAYRQIQPGVRAFKGELADSRSFTAEFIHQHLDAYLHELGLDPFGIDALKLFVG
jgi:Lipase (class 3)